MHLLNFPIGTSDFEKIRVGRAEYVDKTAFIAEIVRDQKEVLLFPRPRRFGKTLNLSMLKYFFDIRKNTRALFEGLSIAALPEWKHLNQYPVILITLKDIKETSLTGTLEKLGIVIAEAYQEHSYLLDSPTLDVDAKRLFAILKSGQATQAQLEGSLRGLSYWLKQHHQKPAVILIDEYDTPIHAAYAGGFYNELVGVMRNLMSGAFKDNVNLFKGVITGILRVSKEGMFSGLNNIDVCSVMSDRYAQHFGFTQEEVDVLLAKTGQPENRDLIRDWYNGFIFGNCQIYNPWSIINYFSKGGEPEPYWIGTSDNALVKQILARGSAQLKQDFELLVSGKEVVRMIDEFITLPELFNNEEIAFSLLLFSGYLKVIRKERVNADYRCTLRIPNREVQALFNTQLRSFFDSNHFAAHQYQSLIQALITGDIPVFEKLLSKYLLECFSYFDVKQEEPERFYHGFVLGLLVTLQETHWVKSNRESGYGRYDVMVIPKDKTKLGTLMEFKGVDKPSQIKKGLSDAFQQIDQRGYATELKAQGITQIQTIAIVFCGKRLKMAIR